jgi:putative component of membrane protein insertase Oxa1/YidC/SpoIIIJ protein YidD
MGQPPIGNGESVFVVLGCLFRSVHQYIKLPLLRATRLPNGSCGHGDSTLLADVTGFFRRRRTFQPKINSDAVSTRPETSDCLTTSNRTEKYKPTNKIEPIRKLCLVVLLCALTIAACAHTSERKTESIVSTNNALYEGILKIYTGPLNRLKSVRRGECPMYPSCSEYSRQDITRYGFAKGWVMTMDRLMRCGRDEAFTAPRILINGK